MKKRAIRPDSHTYLLILRGLADHAHSPHAVSRALSVYHSMSGPKSPAKPSIVHTNAILKVCARAGDTESLFDIVSRMPERGALAADAWTFTTILNHLRHGAMAATEIESSIAVEERMRRMDSAIIKGRKLWAVVIDRWRSGDLTLDEDLICAMGRLLISSFRPRDWDDVLSLVHQTMNVSRAMPRLGMEGRQPPPIPKNQIEDNTQNKIFVGIDSLEKSFDEPKSSPYQGAAPGSKFDVFNANNPQIHNSLSSPNSKSRIIGHSDGRISTTIYATAHHNTLSMVIEACLRQFAKQAALDYWNYFTSQQPKPITPDNHNLEMMLRILRQSHNSAAAFLFLKEEYSKYKTKPTAQAFRFAMQACAHDNRNPNAFSFASQILDLSLNTLPEPDVRTCQAYLTVAELQARNYLEGKAALPKSLPETDQSSILFPTPESTAAQDAAQAQKNTLHLTVARIWVRVLQKLEPAYLDLKLLLGPIGVGRFQPMVSPEKIIQNRDRMIKETKELVQRMIGVCDKLLKHHISDDKGPSRTDAGMISSAHRKDFQDKLYRLCAFQGRLVMKMEANERRNSEGRERAKARYDVESAQEDDELGRREDRDGKVRIVHAPEDPEAQALRLAEAGSSRLAENAA